MTKATGTGFESVDNLLIAVTSILPDAEILEDNEGQLVIYTNLKVDPEDGSVLMFSEEIP